MRSSFHARRRTLGAAGALGASVVLPRTGHAQGAWPSRPIRVVVPYPAGGVVDVMARAAGCRSRWVEIDLPFGHDAFLLDGEHQGRHVREFLARG